MTVFFSNLNLRLQIYLQLLDTYSTVHRKYGKNETEGRAIAYTPLKTAFWLFFCARVKTNYRYILKTNNGFVYVM